jgi:hypothetical protein
VSLKASIFISYKKHTGRSSNCEKSEEATFDTDERSFAEVASEILDTLDGYVRGFRARRKLRNEIHP